MFFRHNLVAVSGVFAAAICGPFGASAQPSTADWVIVASNSEAAMSIDRAGLKREGNKATAMVLAGLFEADTLRGGTLVRYHLSHETFDCAMKTRTEHQVRLHESAGELVGLSEPLETDAAVRPGSIYDDVRIAACTGEVGLGGAGSPSPLAAIESEREKRAREGLSVD